MFQITKCQPAIKVEASYRKSPAEFCKNQVPSFWGGYVAIFEPTVMDKSNWWTVYYFKTKCNTLKKANYVLKVQ